MIEEVLEIIRLSLELALEIVKGIPIEQRQQFWIEHQKRMALFDKWLTELSLPQVKP